MWTRDPSIGLIISEAWQKGRHNPNLEQLMTKLKYTKLALKHWNRVHFGHVQTRIKEYKQQLEYIQSLPPTSSNLEREEIVGKELDETLLRECILWKTKAKSKWLAEGDANTRFFHLSTLSHHKYNHIHCIINDDNSSLSDPDQIG